MIFSELITMVNVLFFIAYNDHTFSQLVTYLYKSAIIAIHDESGVPTY